MLPNPVSGRVLLFSPHTVVLSLAMCVDNKGNAKGSNRNGSGSLVNLPSGLEIQGSIDGGRWVQIATFPNISDFSRGVKVEREFADRTVTATITLQVAPVSVPAACPLPVVGRTVEKGTSNVGATVVTSTGVRLLAQSPDNSQRPPVGEGGATKNAEIEIAALGNFFRLIRIIQLAPHEASGVWNFSCSTLQMWGDLLPSSASPQKKEL